MEVEVMLSTMDQDDIRNLISKMKIETNIIIINQIFYDKKVSFEYKNKFFYSIEMKED